MHKAEFIDPLHIIFEKNLYDFKYEDLDVFIEHVVSEYLTHLQLHGVAIPEARKTTLFKDLTEEVYEMYIKKIHGCLDLREFRNKGRATKLEMVRARDRYYKLTGTDS